MSKRWIGVTVTATVAVVLVATALSRASASPEAPAPSAGATALGTEFLAPEDVAFDVSGNLYVSEFLGHKVDRIDPAGSVSVVAGTGVQGYSGGGPATEALLNMPTGLFFRPNGDLVIADHRNHCIREIDAASVISTIAGSCTKHGTKGDGGPAVDAKLNDPIGITQDAAGNVYIADEQNALVRRIDTSGIITTFAGGGKTPVVGAPDGTLATSLRLSHPSYVVVDAGGNVYFSDFLANEVLRVDLSGRITRVAGTGAAGFSGDGGPATAAALDFPTGLALHHGRLYISDANNNRVRMVDGHGIITTVAGTGPVGFDAATYGGDGGPATAAHLNAPAGLAFDAFGDLVIADQGNNCVRLVTRTGTITLLAGTP